MNTYETIYIAQAEASQEKIESSLEKVKSIINRANGKIITAEQWGRRKLAYPIKRSRDGFYIYLLYSANSDIPAQLDHHFRVTDTILRGLTIKVDPRHLEKIKSPLKAAQPSTSGPVSGETIQTPESVAAVPEQKVPSESVAAPSETSS